MHNRKYTCICNSRNLSVLHAASAYLWNRTCIVICYHMLIYYLFQHSHYNDEMTNLICYHFLFAICRLPFCSLPLQFFSMCRKCFNHRGGVTIKSSILISCLYNNNFHCFLCSKPFLSRFCLLWFCFFSHIWNNTILWLLLIEIFVNN